MLSIKKLLAKLLQNQYKTYDQSVSGTVTPAGSSAPLNSFVYLSVTRPSQVPSDAVASIKSTNRLCWLALMSNGSLRLFTFVGASTSLSATVTWFYK